MNDEPHTTPVDRTIRAPWTPEQVAALNAFQRRGGMHPFTCGGDHAPGSPSLVAYSDGWRCPQPYGEACDYRQDWAHAFMAHPAAVSAVPVAVPPTGQAALRDWIARALEREDAINAGYDHGFAGSYGADAETDGFVDAVLAVLQPPADRAAVLLEVADRFDGMPEAQAPALQKGITWATSELRRLAAETPQPETPATQLPFIHTDDDTDRLEIGTVMASTYDGEAPVVYVAADQHHGDQTACVYVRPERVEEIVTALRAARQAAGTLPAAAPVHVGGGANAEDCPACHGSTPPYPWTCPGPDTAGARQDATATGEPGSAEPRPCRTFVSGGTVWCCEDGETDCPCICHQPAAGAGQDGAQQS